MADRQATYRKRAEKVFLPDYPELAFEHKFCTARDWRFDVALPAHMLAIEIDGGTWQQGGGRHNRPQGYALDIEKMNAAVFHGWFVVKCEPRNLTRTCRQVKSFLELTDRYCNGPLGHMDHCASERIKIKRPKRKF